MFVSQYVKKQSKNDYFNCRKIIKNIMLLSLKSGFALILELGHIFIIVLWVRVLATPPCALGHIRVSDTDTHRTHQLDRTDKDT